MFYVIIFSLNLGLYRQGVYGYGYAPYGPYSPVGSPMPTDTTKGNPNDVKGNTASTPVRPNSYQNLSFNPNGTYGRGAQTGYQDPRYTYDGLQSTIPWLDICKTKVLMSYRHFYLTKEPINSSCFQLILYEMSLRKKPCNLLFMIIRTMELASAQAKLQELKKKTQILRCYSSGSLLNKLQECLNRTDEESEMLHEQLLGKEIDVVTFTKKYKQLQCYSPGNNLVELEVKNTWLSVDHKNQMLMIRKVDPTLDMEAHEGDNYTHILFMIIRTMDLASAQGKLHKLKKKTQLLQCYSSGSLLNKLQECLNKTDEESEMLHEQLLGKEIDVVTFTKKYKQLQCYSPGNNLVELEVKNTWLSVDHKNQMFMIRKVDPTLDMEADEGDNYTHILFMIIRTMDLASAQVKLHELKKKTQLLQCYSSGSLVNKVQECLNKTDEESEMLHAQLLGKEIDVVTFTKKYKQLQCYSPGSFPVYWLESRCLLKF
uniref:VPS37 C-terminal domain-containing protein n=1 Tax=Lactuca sativa TaxID=4236 RepID=A0A9R1UHV8_LACSA|nr:hypothetical protein LSAT_V11C900500110 [Lactuca sativa]